MTPTQLKKLLEKGGLSQRYAAKLLGINERTMRYYVSGDLEVPKVVELALRCLAEHSQDKGSKS